MNNVNTSEDLSSIINVLNDFTLTVLGPLPNNSQLLSLWYKFKPLLAPEVYDPSKVQSFLSSLDNEIPSATSKKPPLSTKYPLESSFENSKEYSQPPQHNGLSRGEPYTKGDTSYELNKKSGNSTQSSNSPAAYNSSSVTHSSHEQNLPKGKTSGFTLKQEIQNTGVKSVSDKHELKEPSASAKGSANYANTSIRSSMGQENSVEYKNDFLDNRRVSKNYEGSLDYIGKTVSEGNVTKLNNLQLSNNNNVVRVEQSKLPEKSSTVNGNISAHSKCLPALEYVNTFLIKPYSGPANSSLYARSILESKQGRNTFYYSMLIAHFLHLLSDRSTSLVLSNLYEKVVIRKVQLVYYNNQEKLYESLTASLKALIHEKIAKPGQIKILQELFLNKFYGDKYFREGLVAVMKELFVDYVSGLDAKTFNTHFKHTKLDKLITAVRTPDSEPTDEMLAVFPNLIEGNIELYYIKANKIENVLYTLQGGKTYKQPQISLLCIAQNSEKRIFHALVTKEQEELLEKIEIKEEVEDEADAEGLKGTVYMSMESNYSGGEGEQSYIDLEVANTLGDEVKEDKQVQKGTVPKISFNRDFLFSKAQELTSFMDKHSEKLSGSVKSKLPLNHTKQAPTKNPSYNSNNSSSGQSSSQSSTGNNTNPTPSLVIQGSMNNSLAAKPCTSEKVAGQGQSAPHINIFPPSRDASSGANSPLLRPINVPSSSRGGKLPPAKDALKTITSGGNSIPDSGRNSGGLYVPGLGPNKTVGVCTNKSKMADISQNVSFQGLNVSENVHGTPPSKKGQDYEKENRDLSSINIRSPLKNIIIYTHQKDAAFAAVEKEASLVEAIMKNSPDGSGGSDRLIFEDSAC